MERSTGTLLAISGSKSNNLSARSGLPYSIALWAISVKESPY